MILICIFTFFCSDDGTVHKITCKTETFIYTSRNFLVSYFLLMSDSSISQTNKTSCGCCKAWCECGDCKDCTSTSSSSCKSLGCHGGCPCCAHFKQNCLICKIAKILFMILVVCALCKIIFSWWMHGMRGWCMSSQWSCMMGSGSLCTWKESHKMGRFGSTSDKNQDQVVNQLWTGVSN